MITLKKISKPILIQAVAKAYQGDQELFDKYHVAPCDFAAATLSTMAMIREMADVEDCEYFKVVYKKEMIGYIVIFGDFLYSYGINIKFRTRYILPQFWEAIKNELPKRFFSMLYDNNTRAASWLIKCGMRELERKDGTISFVYE